MLPQTPEDVSTLLAAAKNFGGWGVSLIMAFYGGRAFMALAREFKTEMVFELKAIRDALLKNEAKLETLVHEFNSLRDTASENNDRLERLEHSAVCRAEKPS